MEPHVYENDKQNLSDHTYQAYGCVAGHCHWDSHIKVPEDRIYHTKECEIDKVLKYEKILFPILMLAKNINPEDQDDYPH